MTTNLRSLPLFLLAALFLWASTAASAQQRRRPASSYRRAAEPEQAFSVGLAPLSLLTRSGKVNLRGEWAYASNKSLMLLVGVPRPTKVPGLVERYLIPESLEGEAVEDRYTSFGVVLEHRFYIANNRPGRGFYLAPYARYNSFTVRRTRENLESGGETNIRGTVGGPGLGGALGWQFGLGDHLALDFTFVGIDFKWMRARLTYATSDPENNLEEWRDEVQEQLEKIPFVGSRLAAELNGNTISVRSPGWLLPAYRFNLGVSYVF
jgi:hypothetical protein